MSKDKQWYQWTFVHSYIQVFLVNPVERRVTVGVPKTWILPYGAPIWTPNMDPCNFLFSIFLFFKTVWGNDSLMGKWLLNGGSQDSMCFIGTTPVPSFVHFSLLSRSLVTHFLISNSISRQRLSCLGSAPILASSRLKVAYFCERILPF